jgi:hypothetical protein
MSGLLPSSCQPVPSPADEDACARSLIADLGRRAFRRPLTQDERDDLHAVYDSQRSTGENQFGDAIRIVVTAILQAPYFLYRWEEGPTVVRDGPLVRLSPHEVASRLSYFFWATTPDETLRAAADADRLTSPEEIAAQAHRLLADPRASSAVQDFHAQWLRIVDLADESKDPVLYPGSWLDLAHAMRGETDAMSASLLSGKPYLETLLTSSHGFVNDLLAQVYGGSQAGATLVPTDLDPTERAGVLTSAGFLSASSLYADSGPPRRGDAVGRRVMCRRLPDYLKDGRPLPALPNQTTRRRFEAATGGCSADCHEVYALGFAFESYDGIGRHRATESGQPIDASGSIQIDGARFAFRNAIDLVRRLAHADEVRECLARHWLRYLLGRQEGAGDARALAVAGTALRDSSADLRGLLVSLTTTRAFTHRLPAVGEPQP